MKYVEMIHLYHVTLVEVFALVTLIHTFCLFLKLLTIFFDLSQPNYARWLVKYHNSLLEAPYAHPEVYQEFRKGMFGIKRNPIDLAL